MGMPIFETPSTVVASICIVLKGRLKKITYKPGFNNKSISSDGGTEHVYAKVLFRLLELMIMDVIGGDLVYFNKKKGSMFYVDTQKAGQNLIAGKGLKENMDFPLVDLRATQYKMPFIAFDPGYKKSTPCKCLIPKYLYAMLIENFNSGKRYAKGTKDFWFNKNT